MRVGFAGLRPRAGMAKPARIAGLSQRSNLGEIAVAALALRKARGTRRAFLLEDPGRAGPFGAQAFPLGEALLQQHRTAIGAQAGLREARDLMRKRLGDFARLPGGARRSQRPMRKHSSAGTLRPVRIMSSA